MPNRQINRQITGDLSELLLRLGELLHATPVADPEYDKLEDTYDDVYEVTQAALARAINEADKDYLDFTAKMSDAMKAIAAAQADIANVSTVINLVAKVVDIAGKIAKKVVF